MSFRDVNFNQIQIDFDFFNQLNFQVNNNDGCFAFGEILPFFQEPKYLGGIEYQACKNGFIFSIHLRFALRHSINSNRYTCYIKHLSMEVAYDEKHPAWQTYNQRDDTIEEFPEIKNFVIEKIPRKCLPAFLVGFIKTLDYKNNITEKIKERDRQEISVEFLLSDLELTY